MATQISTRAQKTGVRSLPRSSPLPPTATIGDLLKRLGNIPAERVRLNPTPGTATKKDVLDVLDRENRPCELVEGTLVEKAMGYEESELALLIGTFLNNYVRPRKLGIVTGADGTIRLFAGLVRIPDVAFASWLPRPEAAQNSDSPTRTRPRRRSLEQGQHQTRDGQKAGGILRGWVQVVWLVDHRKRTVRVHTAIDESVLIKDGQTLDGCAVLPAFMLPLDELFVNNVP